MSFPAHRKNSTGSEYDRRRINWIEGDGLSITLGDDSTDEEVDVTIALTAAGGDLTVGNGVLKSPVCTSSGTFLGISATAYFVYLGQARVAFTPTFVKFHVTTKATGAQTAECGFFSTPAAPNGSGQTLTKLIASGSLDNLTSSAGVFGNASAFATSVAAGTHLWAGLRTAVASAQPTYAGLLGDMALGSILELVSAGALTGSSSFVGSIPTLSASTNFPDLRGLK